VSDKTAGSSAQAEYERRAARHAADVRRVRPRILTVGAVVAIVGLLVLTVSPLWSAVVLLLDLAIVISALFTMPNSITAWQTGAEGELRTGRLLEPLEAEGFRILHDRKIHVITSGASDGVVSTQAALAGRLDNRDSPGRAQE
jgi:hypothetical protein